MLATNSRQPTKLNVYQMRVKQTNPLNQTFTQRRREFEKMKWIKEENVWHFWNAIKLQVENFLFETSKIFTPQVSSFTKKCKDEEHKTKNEMSLHQIAYRFYDCH